MSASLDAATWALERGYAPLPIPRGSKGPRLPKWQELRFESEAELAEHFTEDANIGLILGAASSGLVDVDLDCPEAISLATHLLTQTNMMHGRATAPRSHYWYVVDREVSTATYDDPVVVAEIKRRKREGLPKDPDLKARLVELRSTGGQTVIPPSIHPNGEQLEWTTDSPVPREVAAPELQLRVRVVAAAALLVRYWPPSGLRHDATLALAGGLLRSGWSEKNAAALVTAVGVAVDPEVDRSDRMATVRTTAERLEHDEETSGWRKLGDFVGTMVVDKVREWLDLPDTDEDDEDEDVSTFAESRVALGELIREGVPDPEWVLPGMFYREQIHWWHGEPGDGKTFVLLGLVYRLCEQGAKALWLDEESGKAQTARRLASYGADPDILDARFHYHNRPGLTTDPADLDALYRQLAAERYDVVIFDSVSDMLDQAGVDEDANREVTAWAKRFLEPIKFEYGASVIAIDHVTKSKDSRGKYARGAGAKKSKTDAAWKLTKVKDFNVNRVGLIRLEADKDREGWLEPKIAFRVGGQGGRTLLEQVDAVEAGGNKLPEGELEQRVVEFLRLNTGEGGEAEALPTREVESAVTGKNTAIRAALKTLAEDRETGVRMEQRGTGHYWWFVDLSDSVELDFRSLGED